MGGALIVMIRKRTSLDVDDRMNYDSLREVLRVDV